MPVYNIMEAYQFIMKQNILYTRYLANIFPGRIEYELIYIQSRGPGLFTTSKND